MKLSPLRKRIREYEDSYRIKLPKRTPVILRIDGKNFSTLTKGFNSPWDYSLIRAMNDTAMALCTEIQGAQIAYVQSDEITVFVRTYDKFETSPWFDNTLQKICSVSAAIATRAFNQTIDAEAWKYKKPRVAGVFDSRVFCVPREEVCNCFVDRQQDCIRNSILGLGQYILGKKAVHGMSCAEIKDFLNLQGSKTISKGNVTIGEGGWDNLRSWEKYGRVVLYGIKPCGDFGIPRTKPEWYIPQETPVFQEDRAVVDSRVWPEDEEGAYSKPVTSQSPKLSLYVPTQKKWERLGHTSEERKKMADNPLSQVMTNYQSAKLYKDGEIEECDCTFKKDKPFTLKTEDIQPAKEEE
jgi:tRNA(His) 5'-end guanylyltransferase